MKKIFLLLALTLTTAVNAAGTTPVKFTQLKQQWMNKEIPVKDDGEELDVERLVKAFQQAWPNELCAEWITNHSERWYRCHARGIMNMIPKDREAELDNLFALMWIPEEGKQGLPKFVVVWHSFEEMDNAVCVYDYDVAAGILRPDPKHPLANFQQALKGTRLYFNENHPDDADFGWIDVNESYDATWAVTVACSFEWDGSQLKREKTYIPELGILASAAYPDLKNGPHFTKFAIVRVGDTNALWLRSKHSKDEVLLNIGPIEGDDVLLLKNEGIPTFTSVKFYEHGATMEWYSNGDDYMFQSVVTDGFRVVHRSLVGAVMKEEGGHTTCSKLDGKDNPQADETMTKWLGQEINIEPQWQFFEGNLADYDYSDEEE